MGSDSPLPPLATGCRGAGTRGACISREGPHPQRNRPLMLPHVHHAFTRRFVEERPHRSRWDPAVA
jgi:hypothetical protein